MTENLQQKATEKPNQTTNADKIRLKKNANYNLVYWKNFVCYMCMLLMTGFVLLAIKLKIEQC